MDLVSQSDKEIFENLLCSNWRIIIGGDLDRGLRIVRHHGTVARFNNVKAAIKPQFRDVDSFIHEGLRGTRNTAT